MYYNIAKKVVDPELKEGFEKVSDYSTKVQKILNEDAKIGLKVQVPLSIQLDLMESLENWQMLNLMMMFPGF